MKNLHAPVLIVNGAGDQIIPPSEGRELYALANEPRQFYSLPGRGHNDCFDDFAIIGLEWIKRLRAIN